jgi:hypothetical protein
MAFRVVPAWLLVRASPAFPAKGINKGRRLGKTANKARVRKEPRPPLRRAVGTDHFVP